MSLREIIAQRIRSSGPLTFAEYMDLALYEPNHGYYTRVDRRSGQAGDFYTSVDVGPLFGRLLADQFAEMYQLICKRLGDETKILDLVEVGAGRGRLAADVLEAISSRFPDLYRSIRLSLVERSPVGRASHSSTLGQHTTKLIRSTDEISENIMGIIFANELLDALPVHSVVMTPSGLQEIYIDLDSSNGDQFTERIGPPSEAVLSYVKRFSIRLEPGWRAEINPAAVSWIEKVSSCLEVGFLVLIDYGHHAAELYSSTHANGTLMTYSRHVATARDEGRHPCPWLINPGSTDITSHVDLTTVQSVAESSGLQTLGVVDQTYFLLGIGSHEWPKPKDSTDEIKQRLALKTLLLPGGLGSTHKVMLFGKNVGTPFLRGCAFSQRVT